MKSLVIIFVPVCPVTSNAPASTLHELVQHLITDVRSICAARLAHIAEMKPCDSVSPDQFWTWFLPNPMWPPKERKHR